MANPVASPRLRRIHRNALIVLVVSGCVNYVDRATLAIGNPLIRSELHLSVADMGVLLSAFLWAYAFSQLPTGALVDRLGPRRLLAIGLTIWSIAQGAAGLVTGYGQFIIARVVLGIGEAPQFPTGARAVRDWWNIRERGRPTGIFNCASTLGAGIAAPLLTGLMLWLGWRGMFLVMGVAGVICAAAWYIVYRDPADVELDESERVYLTEGDETGQASRVTWRDWKGLFGFGTSWGMILGFFGCVYMTWIYMSWLPGYLEMQRHMSISHTGIAASVPYFFGVVGSLCGGVLVDWLVARGVSPVNSRKYPIVVSLIGMSIFTIVAAEVESNLLAVGAISVAMFLGYVCSATAWALPSVAAPRNCVASLGAMQNFGGYFGGALAPLVTGFIVQSTGSFTPALFTGAGIGLVSALIYLALVRHPVTLAADRPGVSGVLAGHAD